MVCLDADLEIDNIKLAAAIGRVNSQPTALRLTNNFFCSLSK